MDINEILTRERDSLRDENIELRKRINELEVSLQEALNLLETTINFFKITSIHSILKIIFLNKHLVVSIPVCFPWHRGN